jgi:hypothetical protein
MNACPVCGSTAIHHERVYTIQGQRVTLRFAACLHDAGQTKGATPSLAPPPVSPPPR